MNNNSKNLKSGVILWLFFLHLDYRTIQYKITKFL